MPLPAILAALARVGATVAARVGAPAVARSLVGMARAAGPAVARRAAARAAAATARGSAAAATRQLALPFGEATAPATAPAGPGGFRVLEDTRLTNARSLFQAIYGHTPPAAAEQAAQQVAGGQQIQSAASAAAQSAATAAPAPAAPTPPATPAAPAPAAAPGSTPPSNPRPQTILDRTKDAWEAGKRAYEAARQRMEPVANQVRSLSLDERYQRLQRAGKLLDPTAVGRQLGTPSPTRQQVVSASEDDEERQRQQAIQQSRGLQVGQAAWNAGKKAIFAAVNATNPMTAPIAAATAPVWMYGIISGFERLGRTISDTNRDLAKFDERIADSFRRLDFTQLRSRQQLAQATSGSASMLNMQLAALIREMQPVRESVTTFLNSAGSSLVFIARMAAFLMRWHPMMQGMFATAKVAERIMRKGETQQAQAATKEFLREIRDGKWNRPKAPKPGAR